MFELFSTYTFVFNGFNDNVIFECVFMHDIKICSLFLQNSHGNPEHRGRNGINMIRARSFYTVIRNSTVQ